MSELAPQIDETAAHQACEAVVLAFYWHLDQSDYKSMRELMHPRGIWDRQGKALSVDALIPELSERPPTLRTHHLMNNFRTWSTGPNDREAVGYMTVYRYDDGVSREGTAVLDRPFAILSWRAGLRETAKGWRIHSMSTTRTFAPK